MWKQFFLALVLLLLSGGISYAASPGNSFPGEAPPKENAAAQSPGRQFEQKLQIRPVTVDEVVGQANNLTVRVWEIAQAYSFLMVLFCSIIGALFLILGAITSLKLKLGGFIIIITGLIAFAIINFAPEIMGTAHGIGGGIWKR